MEKELIIIDYLKVLFKNRKFIIIIFLVVTVITIVISLLMPVWYRAQTTILPPIEESELASFSSLISDLPLKALGLGGKTSQAEIFLATLKSRTVMEAAARKFDLMKRYKARNIEDTVKELRSHVGINLDDEGTITLFVEAGTPWFTIFKKENSDTARELARDMANFFITELDRVNKHLKTARAKNARIFIEKRYQQNINDLHRAEEEFKQFQQKNGTIALPEQTTATISAAAELKAQIIAKEVEIGVLKKYVGNSHADLVKSRNELMELKRKYNEFKSKRQRRGQDSQDLFLNLEEVPDLALQYARLYREVMLQEKITEFLLPQYEQAKIQEAKDTPTVQVLDKAVKPIRKHKPKRAIIVIFYSFLSLILSSMYVLFKPAALAFLKELKK